MAADLRIDYTQTRNLGNNVTSKGEEFNSLLIKVKTANESLKSYWEGSDSSKYANAVEEQARTMDQLATTINEIGSFLVRVGDAYEKVSQANQDAIN